MQLWNKRLSGVTRESPIKLHFVREVLQIKPELYRYESVEYFSSRNDETFDTPPIGLPFRTGSDQVDNTGFKPTFGGACGSGSTVTSRPHRLI